MLTTTAVLALVAVNAVSSLEFAPTGLSQTPITSPGSKCGPAVSCRNVDPAADSCCLELNGRLVQTQLWSSEASVTGNMVGGAKNWTIHGLWPDNCGPGYPSFCDGPAKEQECSRAFDITQLLVQRNDTKTLQDMKTYWVSDGTQPCNPCAPNLPAHCTSQPGHEEPEEPEAPGTDEGFWQYEWLKHGTCLTTLKPSCAPDASPEDGTVAWFKQVVSLYHTLPTYEWLEKHGIVPDEERHYDLTSLKNALYEGFGAAPQIVCGENSDEIAEMWYYFNIRGSIRDGTAEFFEIDATEDPDMPGACPPQVRYLPKQGTTSSS